MIDFLRNLYAFYSWRYPATIVYMLQSTEYQVKPYLEWYWQTQDFSHVMHRRTLERTKAARMLLSVVRLGIALEVLAGVLCVALWYSGHFAGGLAFGAALIVAYPVVWAHAVTLPLTLGRWFIARPRERRLIKESATIFRDTKAAKIAVAGSYGKTSMKELLLTVLSEGKNVAATPANKNVAISHAYFARKLKGDEDVLIIEYGEGAPGDVARFAATTQPTHAVITGLAPAHLDHYKTLHDAGEDIFSVADVVQPEHVYVNAESSATKEFIKPKFAMYDEGGALDWRVGDVQIGIDGTRFTLKKGSQTLKLHSGLLGRHQLGPLSLAAALGAELGLTPKQIEDGIAKTMPFEHRMQPYVLAGAWIVDDTYNGNIEGIRAGAALLHDLPGKRKVYVTPGLVDQGVETQSVHEEMGRLIAGAEPNVVVLMKNSVTDFIQKGLQEANFTGRVIVEDDPLKFYQNLSLFVAYGDVVMMQNDWPDNYR
ncbi:MAG TPA: Mur ligase family protein [Candidatus Saccharimonadales bacterium]